MSKKGIGEKYALVLCALALMVAGATYIYGNFVYHDDEKNMVVGDARLTAWVADTPAERERGLMGVGALLPGRGMVFIFRERGDQTFWNKNTLLDLDVIWIAGEEVVGSTELPREKEGEVTYIHSPVPVDMALEVPRGWTKEHHIEQGDRVIFRE